MDYKSDKTELQVKTELIDKFIQGRCHIDAMNFDGGGKLGEASSEDNSGIGLLLRVAEEAEKDQSGSKTTSYGLKKREETKKPKGKEMSQRAKAAKDREFKRFKKWFDLWMVDETNLPQEGPLIDETFLEYARCMIKNYLDFDEHTEQTKRRLLYLLKESNSKGKTMAAMWWMTVKALGKVPRGMEYKKTKSVAEKKNIEEDDVISPKTSQNRT